jgi:prepilin-type N-terminal cleavage/methylation domain-containing protein
LAYSFRKRSSDGFTLLEILVVLGIIGILVTLSFPLVSGMRARGQRVQCMANLRTLYTATELYIQNNGSWLDRGTEAVRPDPEKLDLSHHPGFVR